MFVICPGVARGENGDSLLVEIDWWQVRAGVAARWAMRIGYEAVQGTDPRRRFDFSRMIEGTGPPWHGPPKIDRECQGSSIHCECWDSR